MIVRTVTVRHSEGLHLKAAGDFSQLANKFRSDITVEYAGRCINAKSLLGILSLGIKSGMTIAISATGVDEQDAVDALVFQAANAQNPLLI